MLEALGQAALRILLLASVVQLAMWLFRIRQTQLRLVGWTVVLAASLAMPALQQVTPLQTAIAFDIPSPAMLGIARPQMPTPESGLAETVLADAVDPSRAMGVWLETAYFLVGGILLLRLIIGVALSLRLLRRASPIGAAWAAGIRVRISPDVTAPVTVLNVILLPADIAQWPASMRQSVLAHERAHVARWDYAMLLASQVNRVVFWFSPFAWWLHRRLTTLAELASDDNALQVTGGPRRIRRSPAGDGPALGSIAAGPGDGPAGDVGVSHRTRAARRRTAKVGRPGATLPRGDWRGRARVRGRKPGLACGPRCAARCASTGARGGGAIRHQPIGSRPRGR